MQLKSYFEQMFLYERWANDKILAYLMDQANEPDTLQIFNHLVADALPWLYVIAGDPVPNTVLEGVKNSAQWSVTDCQAHLHALHNDLDRCIESLTEEDITRTVYSTGPFGQQFPHTVLEILTHLLSHGQHHRGQIEWLVERNTGVYLATSFMPFLRQSNMVNIKIL